MLTAPDTLGLRDALMGETGRGNLIRAMSAMVVVVVLMTGTHQVSKARAEDSLKRVMTSKTIEVQPWR